MKNTLKSQHLLVCVSKTSGCTLDCNLIEFGGASTFDLGSMSIEEAVVRFWPRRLGEKYARKALWFAFILKSHLMVTRNMLSLVSLQIQIRVTMIPLHARWNGPGGGCQMDEWKKRSGTWSARQKWQRLWGLWQMLVATTFEWNVKKWCYWCQHQFPRIACPDRSRSGTRSGTQISNDVVFLILNFGIFWDPIFQKSILLYS